jgi:glycosyltransferase involved in cell wall biosynthesis
MLVSIIMPLYNEAATAGDIICQILDLPIEKELIIVNNGSTDQTGQIIHKYDVHSEVTIIDKDRNIGKGDGIITGIKRVNGEYTVIQDGDLEYNPRDIIKMLRLAQEKQAGAVFGSRILNPDSGISYHRYFWGGKLLTILANLLYGVNITDESTCYKMIRTDLLKAMNLTCRRFEFCPEVVAKLGRNKIKIYEIPISYNPRTFNEGKKIKGIDGLEAIWTLIKYRFKSVSRLRM